MTLGGGAWFVASLKHERKQKGIQRVAPPSLGTHLPGETTTIAKDPSGSEYFERRTLEVGRIIHPPTATGTGAGVPAAAVSTSAPRLQLAVQVPAIGLTPVNAYVKDLARDFAIVSSDRVRITNRSREHRVSLIVAFRFSYLSGEQARLGMDSLKQSLGIWKRIDPTNGLHEFVDSHEMGPIELDPESGGLFAVCFWDSMTDMTFSKWKEGVDMTSPRFEITDHVSGETISMKVPGEYPD